MLQVMSRPPTPAPLAPSDPLPSAPSAVMSFDSTRSSSNGCFLPVLTMSNFLKWRVCAMAYLTLQDSVRVLERTSSAAHGSWMGRPLSRRRTPRSLKAEGNPGVCPAESSSPPPWTFTSNSFTSGSKAVCGVFGSRSRPSIYSTMPASGMVLGCALHGFLQSY